jgi:peptidoglycan/LPS O-acetylase OafA/YrhL
MHIGNRSNVFGVSHPDPAGGLGYRPDIDGLRAVAVLAVLVYHAFPQVMPGGFAGVDIFFVISGYLITGIIDREMHQKRFSLASFYGRRIRRIFPALIVVVLTAFVIGWFVLSVQEMEALGENIKGASLFIQNFVLREQIVGYFDPGAGRLPLLHLWSLGIEEQYYIVWPAALLLLVRWQARTLVIVAAFGLASFVACILTPSNDLSMAFYSPIARAWELLAGSLLALAQREKVAVWQQYLSRFNAGIAIAGFVGVVIVFATLSAATCWPGVATLLPVVSAIALIGTSDTLIHQRLLSSRPMVFIGLISYPLYLWHFPLIAYAKLIYGGVVPLTLMWGLVVLAFLLAWLTYRFVERPFRFGSFPNWLKVTPLLAGMAAMGLIGLVADATHGLPVRFPEAIRPFMLSGSETTAHWRRGRCLLLLQPASEFAPECAGHGRHPLLLIWGDSYGAALYPGFLHFATDRGYDVAEYTASACPPLIGYSLPERPFCESINDDVLTRIERLRPDVVILQSTWGHAEPVLREDLPRTVARLKAMNIPKIVLVGPPSGWEGPGLSENVLKYYRETGSLLPARSFYRSTDEWVQGRDALLEALSRELGIHYVSTRRVFCDDGGCLTRIGVNGSELTAFDAGHLTVPASIFFASQTLDGLLDTSTRQHSCQPTQSSRASPC